MLISISIFCRNECTAYVVFSMKNSVFLLQNPLINGPKVKKFAPAARSGGPLLFRESRIIKMYRLLAFRKSVQISMYRLLAGGGVYCQLCGTPMNGKYPGAW